MEDVLSWTDVSAMNEQGTQEKPEWLKIWQDCMKDPFVSSLHCIWQFFSVFYNENMKYE